jgi:putative zinc finger/helix-turn-helix YgiT family protein
MELPAPRTLTAEVRGERLEVQVLAAQCSHCGRVVLNSKGRRVYNRTAADAYRRAHHLLTTHELVEMRRNLGMTWKQFAEFVKVGLATLKRWMGGEIQTPSLDMLVRLRADLSFVERATEELFTRLAANSTEYTTVNVPVAPNRRIRARPVQWTTEAVDTQLGLAA